MVWYLGPSALLLLIFCLSTPILASPYAAVSRATLSADLPNVTPPPFHNLTLGNTDLRKRADDEKLTTCGYHNGDPDRPRSAESGFDCRIDTQNGLWGFCPTTVIAARDCGLAGNCVDKHDCSKGCGITGVSGITTFTCDPKQFCSTVILALDDDAGFSYIACGATALTHTIFPNPTSESETRTTESSEPSESESESSTADTSEPTKESAPSESSTTSPEPEAASDDSGGAPNNTGAIIGGVLGGIALICISVIATVWILRRNRSQKAKEEGPPAPDTSMPMYYTYESAPAKHVPVEPVELDGQRNIRPSELPG